MGRDQYDDRRRALVKGKFKFLYQDETEDLEASDKFELAVVQNKLLGPVKYRDKDGKDPDVLMIYGKGREEGEGFSNPSVTIPGVLDLFTVVWSNPFGDLFVEQDIKLFEFSDIQKYSSYNDGPESREFCRFYTSSSSRELDGFDSSIFWSTGLLWKHFKTCGVEKWDLQLQELVTHYKNWKNWTHEVHNLPGSNNNSQNSGKKFSDNAYSGPASTSKSYSRDRDKINHSVNSNNNYCKPKPAPPAPSPSSSAMLSAPAPGQTVMVPIPGPDGNVVHVQLSTVIPAINTAAAPPQPQSRFKYINPQILVPNVPPPGYSGKSGRSGDDNSWKSQVDDFLYKPRTRSCSPVTSRSLSSREKRTISPISAKISSTPVKKKSKFTPKAQIVPPSPGCGSEVNELDTRPDKRIYSGNVIDWKGKFGFLQCEDINGKIFLHSKDIVTGRRGVDVGSEASFQVLHRDSSLVGAKAVNVTIN